MMGDYINAITHVTHAYSLYQNKHTIKDDAQAKEFLLWHSAARELLAASLSENSFLNGVYSDREEVFVPTLFENDLCTGYDISGTSPITDLKPTHVRILMSLSVIAEGTGRLNNSQNSGNEMLHFRCKSFRPAMGTSFL